MGTSLSVIRRLRTTVVSNKHSKILHLGYALDLAKAQNGIVSVTRGEMGIATRARRGERPSVFGSYKV
jgi:hypothetical protein